MTNLVRIGANFRDFKVIVGRINLCPAAGFGQDSKQEVTQYDHVCDATNELLQRPATSWIL